MAYVKYGIDPALVERVKLKMKNPEVKDRIKMLLQPVTKADLQDRFKVSSMLSAAAHILGEPLSDSQANVIVDFVIAQKIDPSNMFHLIKLWAMFR